MSGGELHSMLRLTLGVRPSHGRTTGRMLDFVSSVPTAQGTAPYEVQATYTPEVSLVHE